MLKLLLTSKHVFHANIDFPAFASGLGSGCTTRDKGSMKRFVMKLGVPMAGVTGRLEKDMAKLSLKRHNRAKQLVVLFGAAGIGTGGGEGADAVLRACCKEVCRPRGAGQRRGREVLVDEHRTSRVSSAVNGKQPCDEELNTLSATRPADWKPPAGQVEQRLVRPAWSQQRDQPGLQCSAEHAAHWGEQVASTGAVLLARPESFASQGQGVPWFGLQAAAR
ncbi:hypothetical protein HaLaN_13788 [Haematococcus lacustris]|uniref:Uncharacterized protein n=1 Tax=Haematococcus lacustris TaxID=44745 RepID=A0A699ZE18_HAELA|nr:hypothetical protein HaLaN_13788 [Haematococcus lacustris]